MSISARYSLPVFLFAVVVFLPGTSLAADAQSSLALSLGKRVDSLDWNINGENNPAGSDPNVLSELEWRELDILQFKAEFQSTNQAGITFRGHADYGWVQGGVSQDSDYAGSNRTLEFSRSISAVDGSRVMDISGGLGVRLPVGRTGLFHIVPMLGYSYHSQDLRMNDGSLVLWNSTNAAVLDPALGGPQPLGSIPGLHSSYDAEWSGPWLGADFVWELNSGSSFFVRTELHRVNFSAEANWNLRTDFAHPVSFTHDANGLGWVLEQGWRSRPGLSRWIWGVTVNLQAWKTGSGTDRTFYSGGGSGSTKLNEVNWSSRSINLSLQKAFAD